MTDPTFFTYILYSPTLDKFYVGSTNDLKRRLQEHIDSSSGFTGKAKDWEMKYTEAFADRTLAIKRELQIKKWKSKSMILNLIQP